MNQPAYVTHIHYMMYYIFHHDLYSFIRTNLPKSPASFWQAHVEHIQSAIAGQVKSLQPWQRLSQGKRDGQSAALPLRSIPCLAEGRHSDTAKNVQREHRASENTFQEIHVIFIIRLGLFHEICMIFSQTKIGRQKRISKNSFDDAFPTNPFIS